MYEINKKLNKHKIKQNIKRNQIKIKLNKTAI